VFLEISNQEMLLIESEKCHYYLNPGEKC
jgi:hypothetical protein